MSMRSVFSQVTLCEVLREINDVLNEDKTIRKETVNIIREKLRTCEKMAKKITTRLYLYNKEYDAKWWENNKDYEEDLKRRLEKGYIT